MAATVPAVVDPTSRLSALETQRQAIATQQRASAHRAALAAASAQRGQEVHVRASARLVATQVAINERARKRNEELLSAVRAAERRALNNATNSAAAVSLLAAKTMYMQQLEPELVKWRATQEQVALEQLRALELARKDAERRRVEAQHLFEKQQELKRLAIEERQRLRLAEAHELQDAYRRQVERHQMEQQVAAIDALVAEEQLRARQLIYSAVPEPGPTSARPPHSIRMDAPAPQVSTGPPVLPPPSYEWQDIPAGAVVPHGCEVVNGATGGPARFRIPPAWYLSIAITGYPDMVMAVTRHTTLADVRRLVAARLSIPPTGVVLLKNGQVLPGAAADVPHPQTVESTQLWGTQVSVSIAGSTVALSDSRALMSPAALDSPGSYFAPSTARPHTAYQPQIVSPMTAPVDPHAGTHMVSQHPLVSHSASQPPSHSVPHPPPQSHQPVLHHDAGVHVAAMSSPAAVELLPQQPAPHLLPQQPAPQLLPQQLAPQPQTVAQAAAAHVDAVDREALERLQREKEQHRLREQQEHEQRLKEQQAKEQRDRVQREQAQREQEQRQKAEQARLEQERQEQEERRRREQAESDRIERERAEKDRKAKERQEQEDRARLEREKKEAERAAAEQKAKAARDRMEAEKLAARIAQESSRVKATSQPGRRPSADVHDGDDDDPNAGLDSLLGGGASAQFSRRPSTAPSRKSAIVGSGAQKAPTPSPTPGTGSAGTGPQPGSKGPVAAEGPLDAMRPATAGAKPKRSTVMMGSSIMGLGLGAKKSGGAKGIARATFDDTDEVDDIDAAAILGGRSQAQDEPEFEEDF